MRGRILKVLVSPVTRALLLLFGVEIVTAGFPWSVLGAAMLGAFVALTDAANGAA